MGPIQGALLKNNPEFVWCRKCRPGRDGSTASTRGAWAGRRRRPEHGGRGDGGDPSLERGGGSDPGACVAPWAVNGATLAGRRRRPALGGRVNSVDRRVDILDLREWVRRKPGLWGEGGVDPSTVPKGGGSDASLGGGRVGGGGPGAGVGRRAATRKQGVGGVGGAGTIPLRRLVWGLSRFGGLDGSRHLHAWRPEASAHNGISGHKETSY